MGDLQRRFGDIVVDVHKYKRQGEIVSVGDLNVRVRKTGQPGGIIAQHGEENTNEVKMLKFPEHVEMM